MLLPTLMAPKTLTTWLTPSAGRRPQDRREPPAGLRDGDAGEALAPCAGGGLHGRVVQRARGNGEFCAFRTHYCCMESPAQDPCCTLTSSARWTRLHGDIFATGQRYYCPVCPARCKVAFGVVVELIVRNEGYYCRAPFPDPHVEDLKAMPLEQSPPNIANVDALLRAIPDVRPAGADWILTTAKDGVYRLNTEAMRNLPMLDWTMFLGAGAM